MYIYIHVYIDMYIYMYIFIYKYIITYTHPGCLIVYNLGALARGHVCVLGGVLREQTILKGLLPVIIHHRVY